MRKAVPVLCIMTGICMLVYPWVSEYLYENRVDSVIQTYESRMEDTDQEEQQKMMELAHWYNEQLIRSQVTLTDPFTFAEESGSDLDYYATLSFDMSGYMGIIEIPAIAVKLPIYHGTDAAVLEHGVGHLKGSSFPVGGIDTHAVLSGHTGLNSAKMFTDLVELEKGDLFFIHILDETFAYEVNGISVVEPSDTNSLAIRPGEDIVTLITCTPYGVNSHRLLVTGERTEYTEDRYEDVKKAEGNGETDSLWMKTYKRAVFAGAGIVFGAAVVLLLCHKIRRSRQSGRTVGRRWPA